MGVPLNRKGIEGLPYHFFIHLNAHIHTSFYSFDYHRECAVASEVPDVDCIPTDWNKLIVIYVPNHKHIPPFLSYPPST